MRMNDRQNTSSSINRTSLLAVAGLVFISTGLSGCGGSTQLTPDDKAYKRPNPLRSKNLFPDIDRRQSYVQFGTEQAKPTPSKPQFTPNGLEIVDLEEGWGLSPEPDRSVMVHYTGYLADGTKFDTSREKGIPFQFKIGSGQVIPGFEQGIMGMKVGGKRKITIPPKLAYGAQGHGSKVPPNATLIYEINLLSCDR